MVGLPFTQAGPFSQTFARFPVVHAALERTAWAWTGSVALSSSNAASGSVKWSRSASSRRWGMHDIVFELTASMRSRLAVLPFLDVSSYPGLVDFEAAVYRSMQR